MNKYEFTVCLKVEVEAFDIDDAREVLHDTFDPGSEFGIEIKSLTIKE